MTKRDLEAANEVLSERIAQLQQQNAALLAEAKRQAAAEIAGSVEDLIRQQHEAITSASQEIEDSALRLSQVGRHVESQLTRRSMQIDQAARRLHSVVSAMEWRLYAMALFSAIASAAILFLLLALLRPGWAMSARQRENAELGQVVWERVQEMSEQEREALNEVMGFQLFKTKPAP